MWMLLPCVSCFQVDGNCYMSVAKLTKEPLDKMHSPQDAPRIYATVVHKGADFRNQPGYPEGEPVMLQVCL